MDAMARSATARNRVSFWAGLALAGVLGVSPSLAEGFDETAAAFDALVAQKELSGAYFIVKSGDEVLFERQAGDVTADRVIPIASATKWVAGAIVMTAVDAGEISLEATAGDFYDDLPADKASMTLAQMFSHTAGTQALREGAVDVQQDPYLDAGAATAEILAVPLSTPPGTAVAYGGLSMHIGAHMVQLATGKGWNELYTERLVEPLGITGGVWFTPRRTATLQPGEAIPNPLIQGGLLLSASDYMKFLGMIAAGGMAGDTRILSEASIAAMEMDQTGDLERRFVPGGADEDWGYAIGLWCEEVAEDGSCPVMSSPGAFGAYPFIDRPRGIHGYFAVLDQLPRLAADIKALRATFAAAYDAR